MTPNQRINKMINKYELKNVWHKLTTARDVNERLPVTVQLHDTVFSVLALIAHHDNITIHGITIHPYFRDTSLSTVKRCVTTLLESGLIKATVSETDKRERLLTVVE
jgi:DNA-binding MarR family transcriptional regulator